MYGGTKQGISLDDVKNYVVLLPSRNEQDAIVKWIESESENIDRALASAHSEITFLREYRTRLIADVVTGKLDVREAAARLPEEAEDLESLDEVDTLSDAEEDKADNLDELSGEAKA